jgi:hypothetical protein
MRIDICKKCGMFDMVDKTDLCLKCSCNANPSLKQALKRYQAAVKRDYLKEKKNGPI